VAKPDIEITTAEAPATLQIELPVEEVVRQRVEVTAQAPKASAEASAPPATLNDQEIHALPLVEQKFKAALPLIPGVIRTPDGRIAVKGAIENQGTLLVDSAETVDPVSGSFSIDVPLDAVESVDVFKSAYQVEYGRFSGGLTTLQTKAPSSRWDYELNDFVPTPRFEAGHLVGIISRVDVLSVFERADAEIRSEVAQQVLPQVVPTASHGLDVTVRDGIVTLAGRVGSDHEGRAVLEAVRHVQGVVSVRDRFSYPPRD